MTLHRSWIGLTPCQELYLRDRCRGMLTKHVADKHFVSHQTVKNTLTVAFDLLNVENIAGACYKLGRADAIKAWKEQQKRLGGVHPNNDVL